MTETYVIGICGGSASGKSTISRTLKAAFGEGTAEVLSLDSYYKSIEAFPDTISGNYDHPNAIDADLVNKHLQALKKGRDVSIPRYDFSEHRRKGTDPFKHQPVIIIEGILLFSFPELRELIDLKIFVDASADIRLSRRLQRDVKERGRTMDGVLAQYFETVRPMHRQYVEPYKSVADIYISTDSGSSEAFKALLVELNVRQKEHAIPFTWK